MIIQKKAWKEISHEIQQYSEELFQAVDDIAVSTDIFYEAKYSYGENILLNGKLAAPEVQQLTELHYAHIPLSIILSKNCELYVDNQIRCIPLDLLPAGSIFGSYEVLDQAFGLSSKPIWSITAGVKNIFSLQKLTELIKFKKLQQQYRLQDNIIPYNYFKHFDLFKNIAAAERDDWECRVLFFPKSVIQPAIEHKPSHSLLTQFITKYSWQSVNAAIDMMQSSLQWEKISLALSQMNIKIDQHSIEVLKHLMKISQAKMPGFKLLDNENNAPLSLFKFALSEVYRCRYKPDIMSLAGIQEIHRQKVFYSFLHPTLLDGNPNLSEQLRSYFGFAERLAYIIHVLNTKIPDIKMPIDIYSSKKSTNSNHHIKSNQIINTTVDHTNVTKSRFFHCVAEVSKVNDAM
ncbi:hypothetical protein [Facilibium subflavum]|uniref:hypothetical protein n=1 Tax=Facilibium subflavum TaxID=2219058 RepID=UPI000E64945C|nr:hypothetical protein [Facilibium subflavum]